MYLVIKKFEKLLLKRFFKLFLLEIYYITKITIDLYMGMEYY